MRMSPQKVKYLPWVLFLLLLFACIGMLILLKPRDVSLSVKRNAPELYSAKENASVAVAEYKININTADAEMLASLPGIGEALALRIIAYRTANGPFASPEAIQEVAGIGQAKYEAIKAQITI
ncbi:MAG: helix-hairpin-helix domain-containing protein [Clostridia bacterium]|nr:helix-hairpin-helix domain-containing protein [Clostridia bacterium]